MSGGRGAFGANETAKLIQYYLLLGHAYPCGSSLGSVISSDLGDKLIHRLSCTLRAKPPGAPPSLLHFSSSLVQNSLFSTVIEGYHISVTLCNLNYPQPVNNHCNATEAKIKDEPKKSGNVVQNSKQSNC